MTPLQPADDLLLAPSGGEPGGRHGDGRHGQALDGDQRHQDLIADGPKVMGLSREA